MVLVVKLLYKFYHDEMNYYNDPRTKDYFLSSNIFLLFALAVVYQKFVTQWGPRYMKDRPPFKLNAIISAYNLLQVILSIRMFYLGATLYIFGPYNFICEPVDYSNSRLGLFAANEVHNYFLVKVLDLMDTVFFVLRKKQKQVTFLHMYHHIMMIFFSWFAVRFFAVTRSFLLCLYHFYLVLPSLSRYICGHLIFVGFLNAFVHAIMYSYYLVALYKKSSLIWWKKYITLIQIFQFSMLTLHWAVMLLSPACGFPKKLALLFFPQNSFMLAMFSQFYYKTYIKNKQLGVK